MSERKKATNEAAQIIGKEMRRIAFEHDIEGPYIIADYVIEWAERNGWPHKLPHRSTIADYLRGKGFPNRQFIDLFTKALELSDAEERDLAWVNTFPFSTAA